MLGTPLMTLLVCGWGAVDRGEAQRAAPARTLVDVSQSQIRDVLAQTAFSGFQEVRALQAERVGKPADRRHCRTALAAVKPRVGD
jgi:S-adenosylhomocysteine hydrolase